jgi:4-hydroxymandelate oxidase
MNPSLITRRRALSLPVSLTAWQLRAQTLIGELPGRIPPLQELVNTSEFEAIARRKLSELTYAEVAGSERAAFDRITFRPRLMIDTRQIDLSSQLFGQSLFTPILIGPLSNQKRFHPDGELAMARGASAAKAVMVVADRSSHPIDQIAAQSQTPLWFQVYIGPDVEATRARVERAIAAGCKVLCVTLGGEATGTPSTAGIDWSAMDRLRKGINVPVVLKGVMSPEGAQKAVDRGIQGIVVSNYAMRSIPGVVSPIEMLPAVVDAVSGKVPVLMDGSIRLGGDVLKALALGAQAVLLGRPALWGLAAYGAEGVTAIVELIRSQFARDMAMCGKVNVKAVDRTVVKIHRR